jgi:hypothetical protein
VTRNRAAANRRRPALVYRRVHPCETDRNDTNGNPVQSGKILLH